MKLVGEEAGFEPAEPLSEPSRFPSERLRPLGHSSVVSWCGKRGSNSHDHHGHRFLRPVRLPVPPFPLVFFVGAGEGGRTPTALSGPPALEAGASSCSATPALCFSLVREERLELSRPSRVAGV